MPFFIPTQAPVLRNGLMHTCRLAYFCFQGGLETLWSEKGGSCYLDMEGKPSFKPPAPLLWPLSPSPPPPQSDKMTDVTWPPEIPWPRQCRPLIGQRSVYKPWPGMGMALRVYMSERQHIYEDLNESSSARPGGSQQLGIPPSPNSKRTPNFSADILARCGDFNVRQDPIIRLYFYQTPIFCIPANILGIRQHFHETPRF